ncbi:NAD(P)/FAD-dependent oxidoreductase [Roseovarius salinarum]|uniref:NAD(P)/FAD-dependent oxidoreductase n=1 Tax=Roseovarius salinarum TaxID=1981892 RepID=UPI000C32B30C|nr:FAD-dependent oxidoreductase [Roseovarius salinarum]
MRIAVIGRGLIGAAASRHLALRGHEVVAIGPDEPGNKRAHDGVFASHYDEGRITRALDPVPFWSRASRESIARYARIATDSGVAFFTETGALIAGPATGEGMARTAALAAQEGIAHRELRGDALRAAFPFFDFPDETLALHERAGAGHVSPRRLVQAQGIAAERAGARMLRATVDGVHEDQGAVTVRTDAGVVTADRALVAAGAFTGGLLPGAVPLEVFARTVCFFEIDAEEATRLAEMPTLVYLTGAAANPYLLPPIRYPDGRIYLKLGGNPGDPTLPDSAAIGDWFRSGGDAAAGRMLEDMLHQRMPGLRVRATRIEPCVTAYTPSGRPHLEMVGDRIAVAAGACGRGAKCSDELGRLGAEVVLGRGLPDWARA